MKTASVQIKTTRAGDPYKVFQMEDGKYLSVFKFDERYEAMEVGVDIADDQLIFDAQYGNYKLKPLPKPPTAPRGGGAAITKAMETKSENIKEAQDRRNEAVLRAGAFRDATLVTLAMLKDQPFPTDADFKSEWERWVKYFMGKGAEPFV